MLRLPPLLLLVALVAGLPARADLLDYVRRPDTAFTWKLTDSRRAPDGTSYTLELVSQSWKGTLWRHELEVHVPARVEGRTALLFLSGGVGDDLALARRIAAPVAVLHQVPN
jgi:PhoPQ-activated pathogenicity-related protein